MKTYVLALDQGTTSSRTLLIDRACGVQAVAQKEFAQLYPNSGWVEQDPMEIWSSQFATLAEVLARADVRPEQIACVGVTNQRETTLVWDAETGKPVYPAIVWQDRRTAPQCAALKQRGVESWVSSKTGLRLDPYFSATKIAWILDNVPGARARAGLGKLRFGTVDTWLIWMLTDGAVHATDPSNASRTLLFDLEAKTWDTELLELFGVPRSLLPEIRPSSGSFGRVSPRFLASSPPITGVAGDQQAALFGQGCHSPGMIKNTYGTGCFLLMNTGERPAFSQNNLLTTVAWELSGKSEYALEGSVFVAGALMQWLRDQLGVVQHAREVDELAQSVESSNGVFVVPAFAGLGAPHWDPYARGAIFGLTRGSNRAHLCRAALEAVALQTADVIHCMEKDSGAKVRALRVDGGMSKSRLLLQIQADLLGVPVFKPDNAETTALGAAMLAGLAVGFWSGRAELDQILQAGEESFPQPRAAYYESLTLGWTRALERSRGWSASE